MKTQFAIVGAGPAGQFPGHPLRAEGIDCAVIERQAGEHVHSRILDCYRVIGELARSLEAQDGWS